MAKQSTQEAWERSPGFVYFIAAGEKDPPVAIKIGVTKIDRLQARIKEHQSSNHEKLKFRGLIPFKDSENPMKDAEDYENDLIQTFKRFQLREGPGREWFKADPELLNWIDKNTSPENELAPNEFRNQPDLNDSEKQYADEDEFWNNFQNSNDINDYEFNAAKIFHDALVLPGYISVLRGSLQFRLCGRPNEIVMAIRRDGKMEIYLNHSNKTLIRNILKKHIKSDKIQLSISKKTYPLIDWNDWKEHINGFRTALEHIAKLSSEEQKID